MTQPSITIPCQRSHDYGIGADLTTGSPMALAVKPEISGVQGAEGGTLRFNATRIGSTHDLEDRLGISAELSAGCGVFGASARFEFAKECNVHTESLFVAVHASAQLAVQSIDDAVLTDHAAELSNDVDRFHERYGTMFVRSMTRGGLFVAIIQVETTSTGQASKINGELKGAFGAFGGGGGAAVEELIEKYGVSANAMVYAEGGDRDRLASYLRTVLDPGKALEAAAIWLETVEEKAVPYQVTLAPLVIARGAPPPPNLADLQKAQDVLVHCTQLRSILLDGLNTLVFVAEHPDRYHLDEAQGSLGELQNTFAKALEAVSESARDAMRNGADAKMPEAYFEGKGIKMPTIPSDLYSAVAAEMVAVPDLREKASWSECLASLESVGLSGQKTVASGVPAGPFKVLSTAPEAGRKIGKGSPVTVTIPPSPPPDYTGMVKTFDPRLMDAILGLKPNG